VKWLFALLSLVAVTAHGEQCTARGVSGLPIVERPSTKDGDQLAVIVTGDGGWRRIDVKIAERLRSEGVSVVGFLTPDYFRSLRTPDESSCALERTIRYYSDHWKRPSILLIGYSRGADVLPFMASPLPADVRTSIKLIALLGLEPAIDFQYRSKWHRQRPTTQYAVKPEVEKLRGYRILCVYGDKETDSLCPALDPTLASVIRVHGAHHFAGDYSGLADTILAAAR
jgi:type IV secretory pathway VirJ component